MENQETNSASQSSHADPLKDSGGENNPASRSSPEENCLGAPPENQDVSSIFGLNFIRFEIVTLFSWGTEGPYGIFVPVLYADPPTPSEPEAVVNRDNMPLVASSPLLLRLEQQNVQTRPVRDDINSANSFSTRNFGRSHGTRQFRNKELKRRGTKSSDLPSSSRQSSFTSVDPSANLTNGSNSFLSDTFINTPKEDKPVKKNSKKKGKKKGKKKRKCVKDSSSSKAEGNSEISHESSNSDACANNPCTTIQEVLVEQGTCEHSESDGCTDGAVNHSDMIVDDVRPDQEVQKNHPIASLKYVNQAETSEFSVCHDLEDRKSCSDSVYSGDLSDRHDLAQDSVLIGSNGKNSSNHGRDVETPELESSEISVSHSSEIYIKRGCFSTRSWLDGVVYAYANHEGSKSSEESDDAGMQWIVAGKRGKKNKTVPKGSSGGRQGNLHGRSGKDTNHAVWKKVQKKDIAECQSVLREVNSLCSPNDPTLLEAYSLKRNRTHVEISMSKDEDGMQQKGETLSKLGRSVQVPIPNNSCYAHVSSNVQRNEMSEFSSTRIDNPVLSRISLPCSEFACLAEGSMDKRTEGIAAGSGHELQFGPVELDSPKCGTKAVSDVNGEDRERPISIAPNQSDTSSGLSSPCDAISLTYLPHLICQRAGQKAVQHTELKQSSFSGPKLQKWVPVGIKNSGLPKPDRCEPLLELGHTSVAEDQTVSETTKLESEFQNLISSSVNGKDFSCDYDNQKEKLQNNEACIHDGPKDEQDSCNSSTTATTTTPTTSSSTQSEELYFCSVDSGLNKIAEAINDVFRVQMLAEAIQMATGGPLAEFEKLLYLFSPVISHETPNISLRCLWKWYESHGSFGLGVTAEDYRNTRRLGADRHSFRAYFVPYLSAVQLFRKHENLSDGDSTELPDHKDSKICIVDTSGSTSIAGQLLIYSVLGPQSCTMHVDLNQLCRSDPCNNSFEDGMSVQSEESGWSSDFELVFEYFESNQPQQRRSMYEKIEDLVRGVTTSNCKVFGDPSELFSLGIQDLHPRSWYAVAWYPIYRIPDDSLRAAFLTYHSFGHLVNNGAKLDSPSANTRISFPVVGLQSYNAQDECWFQLSPYAYLANGTGLYASVVLKDQLKTLEATACLMSRAHVQRGDLSSTNEHPDFEFFVSRKRY